MSTGATNPAARLPRADAVRNRERVLAAARVEFAQSGPDASVAAIARRAGVGAGTLFRHFPAKEDLLAAVLAETFERMVQVAEEAAAMDDPWDGLVYILTVTAEVQARDRAFLHSAGPEMYGIDRFEDRHAAITATTEQLIARGQEAGVIRNDLVAADLPFLVSALGGAIDHAAKQAPDAASPDVWRRYLGVLLDGLRPEGARELPNGATSLEQEGFADL